MDEGRNDLERGLWRNSMSYLGIGMSAVAVLIIVVLYTIESLEIVHSPYIGVMIFFIMPVVFMAGFLVLGWGVWDERQRRWRDSGKELSKFPVLDLNQPRHRVRFTMFLATAAFATLVLTFIAYEAYHFTESLAFCGDLCHRVMTPERTAYQNSPHARVPCAGCHVGPGASWYVRSKVNGLKELYHYVIDSYPKPIPPAIDNLRPARDTCETCHWPDKFYGATLFQSHRYTFDENNTPVELSMLLKIGGGEEEGVLGGGIHYSMLKKNKVTFLPATHDQQTIPVVWAEKEDGTVIEYRSTDFEGGVHEDDKGPRVLDCGICHNRPTHIFLSPQTAMDKALHSGRIDVSLPWIKRVGVEALLGGYTTTDEAMSGIEDYVRDFYGDGKFPVQPASVDQAVDVIRDLYRNNIFPDIMDVNWRKYPDNKGHRDFPGCFRCHDGRHVSESGDVISRDCTICHTQPQASSGLSPDEGTLRGKEWENWHPWSLEGKHALLNCDTCHTGGLPPASSCAGCHDQKGISRYDENVGMGDFECSECHLEPQKVQPIVQCMDCHDGELTELHVDVEDHLDAECLICHVQHTWIVKDRETCYECHDDMVNHNAGDACIDCHDFK